MGGRVLHVRPTRTERGKNASHATPGAEFKSALVAELPHRCVVKAVGVAENANGARVRIVEPFNGWVSYKNLELYPNSAPQPVSEATPRSPGA